jgi:thioredoxin-related protein
MESFLKRHVGKLLVLTSENCPACKVFKERVKESGSDDFVFVDVEHSEEAKILAEAFNIMSVPTVLRVEKNGEKVVVCRLDDDYKPDQCFEVEVEPDEQH